MVEVNGTDHHTKHKDIHQNEREYHGATDYLNRLTGESLPNSECSGGQRGVRKHKGVPAHREDHSALPDSGQVGESCYEKEKERQTKPPLISQKEMSVMNLSDIHTPITIGKRS